jgi:predicted homoserine dehydrogenase-like protein
VSRCLLCCLSQANYLPMGLSEGCVLKRDVPMDHLITFDDVVLPEGRLSDALWNEQNAMFFPEFAK